MNESTSRPEAETETEPEIANIAPDTDAAAAVDAATSSAPEAVDTATTSAAVAAAPAAARTRPARVTKPKPSTLRPLGAYAIVETGGKQYRVSVGDRLSVEKVTAETGSEITLDRVLLLGGDGATRVGTPTVDGAAVTATVEEHYRGEKIVIFKYKPKKRYRRRLGHRQSLTRLTITAISG